MPTQIRVGYRDFTIEEWPTARACSADRLGECDKDGGIIRVRTDFGQVKTASTLLHEVLHAAYHMGNINGDDEENIVSIFANQLTQIWRDNPQFVAFMESTFRS